MNLHPCTTPSRNLRHYSRAFGPSGQGVTLCHEFAIDQRYVEVDLDTLRLCQKCEQTAKRLRGAS